MKSTTMPRMTFPGWKAEEFPGVCVTHTHPSDRLRVVEVRGSGWGWDSIEEVKIEDRATATGAWVQAAHLRSARSRVVKALVGVIANELQ